jgi:IclR family KDG regulon transcriptional repressor
VSDRLETDDWRIVGALSRGLHVITLFNSDCPEWSFADLRRHLDVPKTTIFRILKTLESCDFLTYDVRSDKYRLGSALIPSMYVLHSHAELIKIARPALEELVASTGETACVAIEVNDKAVVADMVLTPHPFKPDLPVGRVLTDLANASSKVLAAFKPDLEIAWLLSRPLLQLTPNTITDPLVLREQLTKIAVEGIAYDFEEQRLGLCGISAPVREQSGATRAALTVVAPRERLDADEVSRYGKAVKVAADQLSVRLGFTQTPTLAG